MNKNDYMAQSDKIRIICIDYQNRSEEDIANHEPVVFLLTSTKEMDCFQVESVLDEANDLLISLGVNAQQCITMVGKETAKIIGSPFAFEQMIGFGEYTSKELLAIHTGDCSLEEAIAIWLLMKYGDDLEDIESVKEEYEKHCLELESYLNSVPISNYQY